MKTRARVSLAQNVSFILCDKEELKLNLHKRFPCAYVVVRFHKAQRQCMDERMEKERKNALLGLVLALLLTLA